MVGELESREGWGRVGSFIAQGDEQQLINKGYFIYHHCCVWCRGAEIAVQAWSFSLSFYSEIWGLNSGCHACIASSLIPWAIPLVLRRFLRRLKVNGGLVSLLLWHTSEIITLEEEKVISIMMYCTSRQKHIVKSQEWEVKSEGKRAISQNHLWWKASQWPENSPIDSTFQRLHYFMLARTCWESSFMKQALGYTPVKWLKGKDTCYQV